MKIYIVLKTL